jgi:hypothetical protein
MVQTDFGRELDTQQVGEWVCVRVTGQDQAEAEIGEFMCHLWAAL